MTKVTGERFRFLRQAHSNPGPVSDIVNELLDVIERHWNDHTELRYSTALQEIWQSDHLSSFELQEIARQTLVGGQDG